jgi:hypothetical protein
MNLQLVSQSCSNGKAQAEATKQALAELEPLALETIKGGYDEGGWCGTHPPGWRPSPLPDAPSPHAVLFPF